jgi:hypothetical protein
MPIFKPGKSDCIIPRKEIETGQKRKMLGRRRMNNQPTPLKHNAVKEFQRRELFPTAKGTAITS